MLKHGWCWARSDAGTKGTPINSSPSIAESFWPIASPAILPRQCLPTSEPCSGTALFSKPVTAQPVHAPPPSFSTQPVYAPPPNTQRFSNGPRSASNSQRTSPKLWPASDWTMKIYYAYHWQ
jgi:hypothetical protein